MNRAGLLAAVPERYRGVWSRTLLATPTQRDTTTTVRWLQTAHCHADLRVPQAARGGVPVPALCQGFAGHTRVTAGADGEVCEWLRVHDFQPPGPHPDAGRCVFETSERTSEYGIHAEYHEIWERLPGSAGRSAVFVQAAGAGRAALLFVAGQFMTRVRPRTAAWPAGITTADTLADVLRRHPAAATALLDFEISFGTLAAGYWAIEHSTLPALEGEQLPFSIERSSEAGAAIALDGDRAAWQVIEWQADGDRIA